MYDALEPVRGKIKLKDIDPSVTGEFKDKKEIASHTEKRLKQLTDLHYLMYAENRRALLIILQGIDASGKDGAIRYLGNGLNPQGTNICPFNRPSAEELDHDYLWRIHKITPGRGEVAILNRSHYEEVSTVKVHPEYLQRQQLPLEIIERADLFKQRYRQIKDFERMLVENGTHVIKFLMHISRKEQEKRLEERIQNPQKYWKYQEGDMKERLLWNDYMKAFEEMITATSTSYAPWYVIPADTKWYRNYLLSEIVVKTLKDMNMKFPTREDAMSNHSG